METPALQRVWDIAEAARTIRTLRETGQAVPKEVRARFFDGLSIIEATAIALLPRIGGLPEDRDSIVILQASLLSSSSNESEESICARALAAITETIGQETDGPARFIRELTPAQQASRKEVIKLIAASLQTHDPQARQVAQEALIKKYDGWIHKQADKVYSHRPHSPGIDRDDLIQVGRMAVLEFAERYDPQRDANFLSFIIPLIFSRMRREYEDMATTVRIPVHAQPKANLLKSIRREHLIERSPQPSNIMTAKSLGVRPSMVRNTQVGAPLTLGDLYHVIQIGHGMGSLDTGHSPRDHTGSDKDHIIRKRDPIQNLTSDAPEKPVDEQATNTTLRETLSLDDALKNALAVLTPRHIKIIEKRFGLDGSTPHTLKETAAQFSLSRERIRQIEARALAKLRNPQNDELTDYIAE